MMRDHHHHHHHHNLPDLPFEIIANILSRIPVKSLLQFRSVSKKMLSLISHPRFVQSHLYCANDHTSITLKRHIVFHRFPSDDSAIPPPVSSVGYLSLDLVDHSWPFPDSYRNAELLASCNGLLLVGAGEKDFFVWNPSTRVYKKLPGNFYHFREFVRLYGFGYDYASDAYKVVRIVRVTSISNLPLLMQSPDTHYDSTHVTVYNSKTQSWRMIIKDFPYKIFTNGQGIFVNGGLHWIVVRADGEVKRHVIVCLDLAEEKFKEVENPSWLGEGCYCSSGVLRGCDFNLGVLRGSLCLIRYTLHESEVWIMNEHGGTKSWNKFLVIPKKHVHKFVPLCFRDNNEMILEECRHKLVTYNLKDHTCNGIMRFCNPSNECVFNTAQYIETLISP